MGDDIPDGEVGDQLPADLNPHGYVGPYQFPDNSRRRITGAIYLAVAVGVVVLVAEAENSPLLTGGVVVAAVGLAVLGLTTCRPAGRWASTRPTPWLWPSGAPGFP